MEEKMFEVMLAEVRLNDMCVNKLNAAIDTLKKQTKAIKRQRIFNTFGFLFIFACVSNINDLIKEWREQKKEINKLKAKFEVEEIKKGE